MRYNLPTMKEMPLRNVPAGSYDSALKKNGEDVAFIRRIEALITRQRNYVFRMPKPGGSAVLLVSGGMDSIVTWEILFRVFRLNVYPIMIPTKKRDPQIASIRYFSTYFRRKYPSLFHEPLIMNPSVIDQDPFTHVSPDAFPADRILDLYNPDNHELKLGVSGTNIFTAVRACLYCQHLSRTTGTHVSTIIYAATSDDGLFVPSQTYAFLRLIMLTLMRLVDNKDMQFTSVFYESSLGTMLNKKDVLLYGHRLGLPLEHTYSCDLRGAIHCGTCLSCYSRRKCFEETAIADRTVYRDTLPAGLFIRKVIGKLKQVARIS